MKPILYQFPISHYCEKVRWALEHKDIEYEIKNLVPGPHLVTLKKIAPQSSTPVLQCEDKTIQGSEAIIDYIESINKHPPLTPTNAQAASMAHEWSRFADRNIGVPLRLFFYQHVLQQRRLATHLLTAGGPWWGRPLYALAFPGIRRVMRKQMAINPENAEKAKSTIRTALDHIGQRIEGRKYLVENTFSRADLTVCALLAPSWRPTENLPGNFPGNFPGELQEFIDEMHAHQALAWAQEIYATHRH